MVDVFSSEKRSEVMSRIRGQGNKRTEMALITIFRQHGITGWRRKYPAYGKPDFIFPALRLTVFVDGCFWHCCPTHRTRPQSNKEFWEKKLEANCVRDKKVTKELKRRGWKVLRIWEHELKKENEKKLRARLLHYFPNNIRVELIKSSDKYRRDH